MTKFIFITGGVVSSLGKGICAASLGALLRAHNYSVAPMKLDPYINVDPGTMSPIQHGEVFVTADGAETDLDLGYYERFIGTPMSRKNNFTAGQVYESVILKERAGDFLGQTVQVIPHITDEIQTKIRAGVDGSEIAIIEIGGTVGDIESLPFLEAIRQMSIALGAHNSVFIHLTLLPYIDVTDEYKTKPTQHSVAELRSIGIQPHFLVCRSRREVSVSDRAKIALFANLSADRVFSLSDAKSIYQVPLMLREQHIDQQVLSELQLNNREIDLSSWRDMVGTVIDAQTEVDIAIVGKYVELTDAYKSLNEALVHAGAAAGVRVRCQYLDSEKINDGNVGEYLRSAKAVLVPGGFGERGVNGKMAVIGHVREHGIPFFGICLGMQIAVIEFARNVVGLHQAHSTEFNPASSCPVIALTTEWRQNDGSTAQRDGEDQLGATMRLGEYECMLEPDSRARQIYGREMIRERHRHRYEFNNSYRQSLHDAGLRFSGLSRHDDLVEIIELPDHPWFIACQFHPEFISLPLTGHPLFNDFVRAACGACDNVKPHALASQTLE
ncbi:MAG: CTP synthase [Proteobacteria bacterium]|nr:CTP synthase [Pseudomonadota bacterium]